MKFKVLPIAKRWLSAVAGVLALTGSGLADSSPFIVAKYPVEAEADNAAKAQKLALAEGRQAALQSLFKRLLPVSAYKHLPKLAKISARRLVAGVSVRSAQNSSTQYIATLDFRFDADAVRETLRARGLPFVEEQAPETILLPVFGLKDAAGKPGERPTSRIVASGRQARDWPAVWRGLDLENALAPLKLSGLRKGVDAGVISAAAIGNPEALTQLATAYGVPRVMVAIAEPDFQSRRLNVTLAGRDAAGAFVLNRSYRYEPGELSYTMELAAVIALGTFEGRWKATQTSSDGGTQLSGTPVPVQIFVAFNSIRQWRQMRQQLSGTPGVQNLQIGGISARGADIALRYPGGGARLAAALANRGITLQDSNGTWIARSAY